MGYGKRGGHGGGVGSGNLIRRLTNLSAIIDININAPKNTFTIKEALDENKTLMVFKNGDLLPSNSYTVSGTTVTVKGGLIAGDFIQYGILDNNFYAGMLEIDDLADINNQEKTYSAKKLNDTFAKKSHQHNNLATKEELQGVDNKVDTVNSNLETHKNDTEIHHTHSNKSTLDTITPSKISEWDNKANSDHVHDVVSSKSNGFMSKEDKTKLDSLENYIHPNDSNTRHVTDAQINSWNNKSDFSGDYNDLINKPTRLSEFSNDMGYITLEDIDSSQDHIHLNKNVLDKLSDNNGTLQYDGKDISGGTGGECTYTNSTPIKTSLGGIKAGTTFENKTMEEMWNMLLYPFQNPVLNSLTANPSFGLKEKGIDTINSINLSARATKGTENLSKIEFLNNSNQIINTQNVVNSGTYNYTYSANITDNYRFAVKVYDTKNNISQASGMYEFIYPMWNNVTTKSIDSIIESDIKVRKMLEKKGNKSIGFTGTEVRCIFAYPSSYGTIRTIKDQNGFNATASFINKTLRITNGRDVVEYRVYISAAPATLDNFRYTFEF